MHAHATPLSQFPDPCASRMRHIIISGPMCFHGLLQDCMCLNEMSARIKNKSIAGINISREYIAKSSKVYIVQPIEAATTKIDPWIICTPFPKHLLLKTPHHHSQSVRGSGASILPGSRGCVSSC